jgi:hypothetical protein
MPSCGSIMRRRSAETDNDLHLLEVQILTK